MKYFGVFDEIGTMIRFGKCQEEIISNQAREGQTAVELPFKPRFNTRFVLYEGEVLELGD